SIAFVTPARRLKRASYRFVPIVPNAFEKDPSYASRSATKRASRFSRCICRVIVKSLMTRVFPSSSGSKSLPSRNPETRQFGVRDERKYVDSRPSKARSTSVLPEDGGPTTYAHNGSPSRRDVATAARHTSSG